jgi:hypothetical protein
MQSVVINFDDPKDKRVLWDCLRTCKGRWRIQLCRYRPRRSDAQNAYYHGVVVPMMAGFLREQGDDANADRAHEILKAAQLRIPLLNKDGEVICETVGSTAKLTTTEFIEYLDRCCAWMADMFDLIVPNPGEYRKTEKQNASRDAV